MDWLDRISTLLAQSTGADRGRKTFLNEVVHPWVEGVFPDVPQRLRWEQDSPEAVFSYPPGTIDRLYQGLGSIGLPTTGQLYLRAMMGDTRPVGNESFSPEELGVILRLAQQSLEGRDSGSVQYEDYESVDRPLTGGGIFTLLSDSAPNRVQTSLGRFNTYRDEDGTIRVVDRYNFNPNRTRAEGRSALIQEFLQSQPEGRFPPEPRNLYRMLRLAGEAYGPRGGHGSSGMPVELVFRPEELE